MIGSRKQLSRITTQDETWVSTAIGHLGTQVLPKIGTAGGSPSAHTSLKSLAGSKSSWIPPSTTRILRDSPGF